MTRHCDSHTSTGRVGWSGGYETRMDNTILPRPKRLRRVFLLLGSFLFRMIFGKGTRLVVVVPPTYTYLLCRKIHLAVY